MAEGITVSVHDTVPVWRGDTAGDALRRSIDLAKAVESFGYRRFWVAEHHSTPALATSSPAVLAGSILEATETIRVGSGAVLLPNHPPLVVAEQFGVLASLYPDRVDLGLGRGGGGPVSASSRMGDPLRQDFAAQLAELGTYFDGRHHDVRAVPEPDQPPEFWMVGSSAGSAAFAASLGLPYVYAHSIVGGGAPEALEVYRREFRPSAHRSVPHACVAVIVVAADDNDHAQILARSFAYGQILMRTTDMQTVLPTQEETAAHIFTSTEEQFMQERIGPQFIGTPDHIAPRLGALLEATRADELFVLTQVPDHQARVRSYELTAKIVSSL